ncbi:Replication protein [Gammaproteobacteria bacterium]
MLTQQLILSSLEETEFYHDSDTHGFFALLWKESNGQPLKQRSYLISEIQTILPRVEKNRDTYVSQAGFNAPCRRIVHLLRLGLCFVDLDYYKTEWNGKTPEEVSLAVSKFCSEKNILLPSLSLYSGRGLQIKWFFDKPIFRADLARWVTVQKYLVSALSQFGADPNARDASRVLRLVDTINSKSGERVRVVWENQNNGKIQTYPFALLEKLVPPEAYEEKTRRKEPRRSIIEGTVLPKKPKLEVVFGDRVPGLRIFSGRHLAWNRLEDLRKLAEIRGWTKNGVPHGYRSKYIHWSLNFLCLSGAAISTNLLQEAEELVKEICPGFEQDKNIGSILSTLFRKAQEFEAGGRIEFEGKLYPPLYTPRNSTLIALFHIQEVEFTELKTIIPSELAQERDRLRHRKYSDRDAYLATAEQRKEQAKSLRAKGLSWAAVGEEMGISATAARLLETRQEDIDNT